MSSQAVRRWESSATWGGVGTQTVLPEAEVGSEQRLEMGLENEVTCAQERTEGLYPACPARPCISDRSLGGARMVD